MKEIKFSLYEILGYLLPGYMTIFSIVFLHSVLFNSSSEIDLNVFFDAKIFFILSFIAYISGHMIQAVANIFSKYLTPDKILVSENKDSKGAFNIIFIKLAEENIRKIFTIPISENISLSNISAICDEYVTQNGNSSEREIYVYREGFYRGLTVAFFMLAFPSIFSMIKASIVIVFNGHTYAFARSEVFYFLVFIVFGCFLSFKRYKRFYGYKIKHSILSFVSLVNK